MKFVCLGKVIQSTLITLLILLLHFQVFSQTDSVYYWQKKIASCKSISESNILIEKIKGFYNNSSKESLLANADLLLQTASESKYAYHLFNELFYLTETISNNKKLETQFAVFAIKLENNPRYNNIIVQNQLYYYYTLLYFRLKEFYNADKYCNLFLKYGMDAFDSDNQSDHYLNAMTISALIDVAKNELESAYKKLNATLDSCISQKNKAWFGITKGNIGDVYYRQGNFEKAIHFLNEDIRISIANNQFGSAINSYTELKDLYTKQNKIEIANLYIDSANNLLRQILDPNPSLENLYLRESFEINSAYANKYYLKKDFVNASHFFAKAFELKNLIEKNEKENQIKNIVERIELNKTSNEFNELHEEIENKKTISFYFQVILMAIAGVLIIYIIFFRRLKYVNKVLLEKNEIIHQQNLELEKINNDKDKLFSIISHDLRGPSRNLQLIFKAVGDNKLPFSALENQLPNIIRNTSNLVNTLESLLNWSASQLRGIKVNKVLLDVNESIEETIHFFEDQALKKNIRLVNNSRSTMVKIDKNHIEIILRNLTSNAIKFSKQNSSIQFNLITNIDFVEVYVMDEGMGLSNDQVNNILNNTAMKSSVGTLGEKGIGLGLLLTKEFIEINGGNLHVSSELNKGTSMSFTIPK